MGLKPGFENLNQKNLDKINFQKNKTHFTFI